MLLPGNNQITIQLTATTAEDIFPSTKKLHECLILMGKSPNSLLCHISWITWQDRYLPVPYPLQLVASPKVDRNV